jgi:uncharacterized SAM-binding protein YcdF (DUF218 family)
VFFLLSKILDVVLSPYAWGLLLLAAAVPWRRRSLRTWKRRRALGIAGLAMLVLFATEPVSNAIVWSMEHDAPSTYRADVVYDAVVLLGGVTDDRVMAATEQPAYNDNVERLVMTHRLLADGRATVAIVSGAPSDPSLARVGEARALVDQMRAWGIAEDRLIVEDRARNTRENAVFSAEIIRARGYRKVLIVTSAFHMKRAAECFNAVDLEFDTLAVDYRAYEGSKPWLPRPRPLAASSDMIRELFGRLIYRLQGYARSR